MSLHLHSAACEAYLTEPDDDYDVLEAVEFPRERATWKRDRHELRRLARLASRDRGPWVRDDRGWDHNLDHAQRFAEFNLAGHYRYRARVLADLMRPAEMAHHKRCWRLALNRAAQRHKPPLPSARPSTGGAMNGEGRNDG